jgi:hypothetical protein
MQLRLILSSLYAQLSSSDERLHRWMLLLLLLLHHHHRHR